MHETLSITYEDFCELAKSAKDVSYVDDPHRIEAGIKTLKKKMYETAQERELDASERQALDMCLGKLFWTPDFIRWVIEES